MREEHQNPAIRALSAEIASELLFGQVLIRRTGGGFELRHTSDALREAAELRLPTEPELRLLAQFTATGAFRPLKSAPNLRTGWRFEARDGSALGAALDHLYPGAVADWFAARSSPEPITSYRQFTARQTGMYRITTLLDDAIAGAMIRACCHSDFCLKQRLWTVEGLGVDASAEKSLIPCFEPCAILLEFARKVARWEKQESSPRQPADAEVKAETAVVGEGGVPPAPAECDFDAPDNPRRLRFILEKRSLPVKPAYS